jgi:hypothetical protein
MDEAVTIPIHHHHHKHKPHVAHRPPLGLPVGSVRALLTLIIVGVVIWQLCHGEEVQLLWSETLMIALAHYFTSRRFINLPNGLHKQLFEEGRVEKEIHPLGLPKNTIRTILILAFVGAAIFLYKENKLFEPRSLSIIGVVFAYFVGIFIKVSAKTPKGIKIKLFIEDTKAVGVLALMIAVAAFYVVETQYGYKIPHIEGFRNAALASVLFYFGSR